jgi:putative component of membrane protein insertase Oxa1/YidC/SpoIIIJ protein YidD
MKKIICIVNISFTFLLSQLSAQTIFANDLSILETKTKQHGIERKSSYGHGLLNFYKRYFSSQDGNTCTFSPSCSEFASRCLRKFGLGKALLLTSDRLCRCNRLETVFYKEWTENEKPIDDESYY